MRVILAAAAALVAITVSGCDINTGPPKTAKVECNCAVPAAPPAEMRGSEAYPPPAAPYRYHGHRRPHGTFYAGWHDGHSHYWRREYAETSVFTYDYHSGSSSSSYYAGGGGSSGASAYAYAGAHAGGGAYAGGGAHGGDGYHVVDHGWVDGYGRGHDGGATAGEPVHYETHGDHGRLHPWHGYDADCPDDHAH
jgi:hypothetical protein